MDEKAKSPEIDGLGGAINEESFEGVSRLATGSIGDSMKKELGDSQLGELGAKLSSVLGETGLKPIDFGSLEAPRFSAMDYSIPDLSANVIGIGTEWHQLIILGNGFDLQCGLQSRFGDFFKSRFEIISSISDCKSETWKELAESTNLTLWDFILEANIDSLWCDIEGVIEKWVLSAGMLDSKRSPFNRAVEFIKLCPFTDGPFVLINGRRGNEQDDESYMLGNIARYAWTLCPEIATEGYSRELFMALIKGELTKLERAFNEYLTDEVANNENYAERCRELYDLIEQDGKKCGDDYYSSTSVLSFNYTDQIEKHFNGGEDGACVNIHGKLGGEIIFGIDGKDCMDNSDAMAVTKTFRLMRRGGSRTDKLIHTANSSNLQDATDVIKFYGHSLGKADYSYFQSIFDGVDLYESKTVLVFYHPCDESDGAETKNEEWRTSLANSINDLLVAYGATLDNKDHGKNLMHKLLLEGRLILRGVSLD